MPPALAGLPLLCKGCGAPLTVPDAPAEPEPEPPPRPTFPVARPDTTPPPRSSPIAPHGEDDDDRPFLIAEPDNSPDIDFDLPGPTASSRSDTHRSPAGVTPGPVGLPAARRLPLPEPARPKPTAAKPVVPGPAPKPAPSQAALPSAPGGRIAAVADAAVGFILLAVGVFAGEVAARKSTRQVWADAGSAVTFPPVDLILWAGPPVLILLAYALLVSRGKTLGGWLRRRA